MTLPTSGPISLLDIQNEFGGTNPISLDEYYANGGYVDYYAIGYPPPSGQANYIPAIPGGTISIGNFYGANVNAPWSRYLDTMFSIRSNYNNADNDYFGGDIPRFVATDRLSDMYLTVYTPSWTHGQLYLNSSPNWGAQFACGYTYSGGFGGSSYYYDEMSKPGLRVYRDSDGVYMGGVDGDTTIVNYSNSWGIRYCPDSMRIAVDPDTYYRIYYNVHFYRPSNAGFGDQSFGWYDWIQPYIYVTNY